MSKLWSGDVRMRQRISIYTEISLSEYIGQWGAPRELKHLSTWRKRNPKDSVSSGERKRRSLNRALHGNIQNTKAQNAKRLEFCGFEKLGFSVQRAGLRGNDFLSCKATAIVVGALLDGSKVTNCFVSWTILESETKEGNSPVSENETTLLLLFSSRAGPEKSRLKPGPL